MLADLLAAHPVALPSGRIVRGDEGDGGPAFWLSDARPSFGLWRALAEARAATGLAPVLAAALTSSVDPMADEFRPWESGEFFPDTATSPDDHDPAAVLERWWTANGEPRPWPGRAAAAVFPPDAADAVEAAFVADLLSSARPFRLALAPGRTAAAALASAGWSGPANYHDDFGPYAAVLADWETRFGARVVAAGFAELWVGVAALPARSGPGDADARGPEPDTADRLAAEHLAFCPDNLWQGPVDTLAAYARLLRGRDRWTFWWD